MEESPRIPHVEVDGKMLEAMSQIQDFLSTEETMDRLTRTLAYRQQERKAPEAGTEAAGQVANTHGHLANSQGKLPFMGVVSRPGPRDAASPESLPASSPSKSADSPGTHDGEATSKCEASGAAMDWDADVDDLSEREPAVAKQPYVYGRVVHARAPRPSAQLRLHAEANSGAASSSDPWNESGKGMGPSAPMTPKSLPTVDMRERARSWDGKPLPMLNLASSGGGPRGDISFVAGGQAGSPPPPPQVSLLAAATPPQVLSESPSVSLWRMRGAVASSNAPSELDAIGDDMAWRPPAGRILGSDGRSLQSSPPSGIGRVQINLDGSTPRMMPKEAFDTSNPYVKALRAHREELLRNSMDLRDMNADSLATRLATQRHDGLAILSTNDPGPDIGFYDFESFSRFRCGPEPCGDGASGEMGEVNLPEYNHDDELARSLYVRVLSARPSPTREPLDTARSFVDANDLAEGVPCKAFRLPTAGEEMPPPKPPHSEDASAYLHGIGAC